VIFSPFHSRVCFARGVSSVSEQESGSIAESAADENANGTEQCAAAESDVACEGGEYEGEYDEAYDGPDDYEQAGEDGAASGLAPNQIVVTLSLTLINQIRQVARMEGVAAEDFVHELVAEGVTRRAFEDATRAPPSHLMTHTGYVASDANGYQAPKLSHHNNQNRGGNFNGGNQRRYNNQNRGGGYNNSSGNGNGNGNGNGSSSGYSNSNSNGNSAGNGNVNGNSGSYNGGGNRYYGGGNQRNRFNNNNNKK
jgi:hypothetical protein